MSQGPEIHDLADDPTERARRAMVREQIEARGIANPRVLEAMRSVPRHRFVPPELASQAYEDRPLAIGLGQTISQPYIVGLMTALLEPAPAARMLEIGTGSGYQAAVLAAIGCEVHGMELLPELSQRAAETLRATGYGQVEVHTGDGADGWPAAAPYDGILVAAAAPGIPRPLLQQLAPGGRLILPVGHDPQSLLLITRTASGYERRTVAPVRFVPMVGKVRL
jgi:protein-L-isoaspartate(D-aspartate) O-methyltransferase